VCIDTLGSRQHHEAARQAASPSRSATLVPATEYDTCLPDSNTTPLSATGNADTGDADFAHLALLLRWRGIRVEVASLAQTLGAGLKTSANEVIDLAPLLATFDALS